MKELSATRRGVEGIAKKALFKAKLVISRGRLRWLDRWERLFI